MRGHALPDLFEPVENHLDLRRDNCSRLRRAAGINHADKFPIRSDINVPRIKDAVYVGRICSGTGIPKLTLGWVLMLTATICALVVKKSSLPSRDQKG